MASQQAACGKISTVAHVPGDCITSDALALSDGVGLQEGFDSLPKPDGTAPKFKHGANGGALGTASSLPLSGIHAASGSLEHFVKGLSSPSFHNTLASPHKLGLNDCGSVVSKSSVTAASATAAFALSMTLSSAAADLQPDSPCCRQGAQYTHTDGGVPFDTVKGGMVVHNLNALVPPAEACWPCRPCWHGCMVHGSAGDADMSVSALSLSTKRGLYEGTVRGGSVRNTWLYISTRNTPG